MEEELSDNDSRGSQEEEGKGAGGENIGARLGGEMWVQEQEKGLYAGKRKKMQKKK